MTEIHRQATRLATTANPGTGVSADKSKIRSLQDTPNPLLRTLKRPPEKQRLGPQLPVNVDRLSFLAPPVKKKIKVSGDSVQKCSPWSSYHRFMELEQAGPSTISHDREHFLVAVKEKKYNGESTLDRLRSTSDHNVVDLVEIFHDEGIIYMAYECMEVSLRSLSSTSKGKLKHFEIAAVCKEILDGLSYIHTELQLYYGELNCGNVWLKRDGAVKLANVGDAMLNDVKISEDTERKDVCTMGLVMKELMEPETSLQNSDSIVLKYPENWPDGWGIRTFLEATQSSTLNELKKQADFLPGEPTYRCLIPRVCMTEVSARREWKIFD